MMRKYFTEGDLISVCKPVTEVIIHYFILFVPQAEVQQVFSDGSLSLHTRSLKYGKVRNIICCVYVLLSLCLQLMKGCLLTVPPLLVKRCKNHFHNMLCGASVILGVQDLF